MTRVKTLTPMLEQYFRLKSQHPEALLMFRLGDFYELFDADAKEAAPLLDLQLTSRDGKVPMCGVPHHALNQYAKKLIQHGLTVAIAEQMEDPATSKGLVDRQIVRVLTPGTMIPDDEGDAPRLGVLFRHRQGFVAILAELSTGTCHVTEASLAQGDLKQLYDLWEIWNPDEILTNDDDKTWGKTGYLVDGTSYFRRGDSLELERLVTQNLGIMSLRRWGLEDRTPILEAFLALWRYLERIQRQIPVHLTDIQWHPLGQRMGLAPRALRQLNVLDGAYSLYQQVNQSVTPMGARRIREWLEYPLVDGMMIRVRQDAVTRLVQDALMRATVRDALKAVGDLSRRVARVTMGIGRPRDIEGIRAGLMVLPSIVESVGASGIWPCPTPIEELTALSERLQVLVSPVPSRFDDTPLIGIGNDAELDRARRLSEDHRQALLDLEAEERQRSGIKSLKVGYHRTFGYYLEVSQSQAKTVPDDWHRRQTTAHTERYVSDGLRTLEMAIRSAEDIVATREAIWADQLQQDVRHHAHRLSLIATWLSDVDALGGLAEAAVKFGYRPPVLGDNADAPIVVTGLRHPVLERVLNDYVTTDLELVSPHHTLIITGPNMGGKSTFMRALAVNVLMAQVGGYVAAETFHIPIFDRILTRMGADDDLVRGQSTFMVEMEEVAAIVHGATASSLILLDELGRGTSTFDGLAIAQAVVERLAMAEGPLTLFATHYHELTRMADDVGSIINLTVEVVEDRQGPVFTHRILPGQASRSYGIEVAKQAGLPPALIRRAERYLTHWEGSSERSDVNRQITFYAPHPSATALFEAFRDLDLNDISPREAWLWMSEWQRRLSREEGL